MEAKFSSKIKLDQLYCWKNRQQYQLLLAKPYQDEDYRCRVEKNKYLEQEITSLSKASQLETYGSKL